MSSRMSSLRKKVKPSLEERREKNRQRVLSISFMFPTVEIDVIITALMTCKGNMEKAILLVSEYAHKTDQHPEKQHCNGEEDESIEFTVEEELEQGEEEDDELLLNDSDVEVDNDDEAAEEERRMMNEQQEEAENRSNQGFSLSQLINDHYLMDDKEEQLEKTEKQIVNELNNENESLVDHSEVQVDTTTTVAPNAAVLSDNEDVVAQQTAIIQIKDFFPALSDSIIHEALIKCHHNADDTCAYLVAEHMEEPEEEADWEIIENPEQRGTALFTSSKWLIIDDYLGDSFDQMTESIVAHHDEGSSSNLQQDEEQDHSESDFEEEEQSGGESEDDDMLSEGEEEEDETLELEILDTTNFSWFQEAKEAQNTFSNLQYEQDETLARLLQEQEFAKIEQMIDSAGTSRVKQYQPAAPYNFPNGRKFKLDYDRFHPDVFWPNSHQMIQKQVNNLVGVQYIVQNNLLRRFREYCKKADDPIILLGYHGTRETNIASIKKLGLLIPGRNNHGVSVANGSALGTGIYVSLSAQQSITYCYGGTKLIACAIAIGKKCITTKCGDVIVSFNEAQVLPCWEVTFRNPYRVPTVSVSRPAARRRTTTATPAPPRPTFALTTIPKRLRAKNKDKVLTKKERQEKKLYTKKKTLFKKGLLK